MTEAMNRESRENKIIRRNGMIIAIMLTALLLISLPGTLSGMFGSLLSLVTSLPGLALELLVCIGAWLIAFKKPAGGAIVSVVMTIYRILIYVLMGILLLGMIVVCAVFSMNFPGEEVLLVIIGIVVGVLIIEGVLFFTSALYTGAARVAGYIRQRCNPLTMHGRNSLASALPVLLIILSVLIGIGLFASLSAYIVAVDEFYYYGYNNMGAGELVGDLMYELQYAGMDELGELIVTPLYNALAGSMKSTLLGVNNVVGILQLFLCIYGCCTVFSLKNAGRS